MCSYNFTAHQPPLFGAILSQKTSQRFLQVCLKPSLFNVINLSGQYKDTPCGGQVIAPVNVSASASGVNHVTVRWFKPIPANYNFDIHYHASTAGAKDVTDKGPTAFGPLYAYQAYDLTPQTTYEFFVKHTCKDKPSVVSAESKASGKTFGQCKFTFKSKRDEKNRRLVIIIL